MLIDNFQIYGTKSIVVIVELLENIIKLYIPYEMKPCSNDSYFTQHFSRIPAEDRWKFISRKLIEINLKTIRDRLKEIEVSNIQITLLNNFCPFFSYFFFFFIIFRFTVTIILLNFFFPGRRQIMLNKMEAGTKLVAGFFIILIFRLWSVTALESISELFIMLIS